MYVNVRMSGQRDVGMYGHMMKIWMYGHMMNIRMYGHMMNIWMCGRVDVAMYAKTREP